MLFTQEITLPTGGKYTLTWPNPRRPLDASGNYTGRAWAREVSIKPHTTAVTISVDGGKTNMTIDPSTVEQRFSLKGLTSALYISGTAGNTVEVAADLAV